MALAMMSNTPKQCHAADRTIKVLFGIDMETDVGSFTPFYEGVKNGTPKLLDLFAKKNITGTFFFYGRGGARKPADRRTRRQERKRSRLPLAVSRDGRR
jgi:hypothetical protein